MSDPAPTEAAPPPQPPPPPPHDDDVSRYPEERDGFPRVLRAAALVAAVVSALAAAHGLIVTAQHYLKEIPAGTITRVEPGRGGYRIATDAGASAVFPADVLETTGSRIALRPGTRVAKPLGTLTYAIGTESRGGLLWAMRQWLLPARVTLPLVIYFVVTWLLVFRAPQHRRPILVELIVIPVALWGVILLASLIAVALILGCGALLFRMAG